MAPFTIKMHASLDSCFRIQYSWDLKEALPERCEAPAFDKIWQNLYEWVKEREGLSPCRLSGKCNMHSDDEKNGRRGQKRVLGAAGCRGPVAEDGCVETALPPLSPGGRAGKRAGAVLMGLTSGQR